MRTLLQLFLIAGVAASALVLLSATAHARHQAVRRLLLGAFTVLAVSSVLVPELWSRTATFLGVGRGSDLLLYATVVSFLGYVAASVRRFRDMEVSMTRLARRLALDETPTPLAAPDSEPAPLFAVQPVEPVDGSADGSGGDDGGVRDAAGPGPRSSGH